MASDEHKKLASFIKATHNQLREDSRIYGASEAWKKHLARTKVLQKYARSMQELATKHWNENMEKDSDVRCRNKWIKLQCYEYFFNRGKEKFDKRENDIRNKMIAARNDIDSVEEIVVESSADERAVIQRENSKIKLLDVGSCYNPLGAEEMFEVTPIDLAPYSDKVMQCDFLNVKLGTETIISSDGGSLEQLKEASYDVVVFSLLLEYFPCPEQRFLCCRKAYSLLKVVGILIIITPDSNHIGANAKIMKSWRLIMSRLGFMRIVYEKTRHLCCLGFRKCVDKNVGVRWSEIQVIPENDVLLSSKNRVYIPQDFQTVSAEKSCENVVYDVDELVGIFDQLPFADDVAK